ncbi:MAG: hypothetical protein ABIO60_12010 [Aquaticitalea sp.]
MTEDKKNKSYNPEITKEDREELGEKTENLRSDGGDDEQLKHRQRPVDFEVKDLDIPGRTLPEDRNKKQLKNEENQLYSEED